MAVLDKADIVICAVPGISTLKAVVAAVAKGRTRLATKRYWWLPAHRQTACKEDAASLLPVDSEHNAIFSA